MGFSSSAIVDGANAMRTKYVYAQLHTAAAGAIGLNNVSSAGRESVTWTATTPSGSFELAATVSFTDGEPFGPIFSVTLWSEDAAGTFGGEFKLPDGTVFNSSGAFNVETLTRVPKLVAATGRAPA